MKPFNAKNVKMKYYSLNKQSPEVSFREAAINGQAPDKGLYFPERIPELDPEILPNITRFSEAEIGFRVLRPYVGGTIPDETLYRIVEQTVNFPFPLVQVTPDIYALELFHGPTLAFKDVGARFMSRCLGYFARENNRKITVLVATSGDTGGAVADGFYNVPGIEVVILYPSGRVSPVQEKQLTTHGGNIRALEVNGNFDDCQQIVKQAFADADLQKSLFLTSANSINVARWLPQQLYYFFAYRQWPDKEVPPVISVPSGNFGNICSGILANASGLPIKHFIAACNANDVVPRFLQTGFYSPANAIPTISNAMDVGNPSNFVRILEIFRNDIDDLKHQLSGYTIDDDTTRETIRSVYRKYNYLLDPHGAVGFKALENYQEQYPERKGIVLETAHPVKFPGEIEAITGKPVEIPASVAGIMNRKKQSTLIEPSFNDVKEYLLGIDSMP